MIEKIYQTLGTVFLSSAIQTPHVLSKILRCVLYFHVSPWCLNILMTTCLSCLKHYIPNHFHYRSPRKGQSVLHTTDQDWLHTLTGVAQQHMIPTSGSMLLTIKLIRTNQNQGTLSNYEGFRWITLCDKLCTENVGSLKCSFQSQNMGSLNNKSQKSHFSVSAIVGGCL